MVETIEDMLGIAGIRCSIVGNAGKRGISGGQKKSVLESRASVKRKDVVRRPTAEEDCLTPITSRRSGPFARLQVFT